jgi:hypothetical protein
MSFDMKVFRLLMIVKFVFRPSQKVTDINQQFY